MANVLVLFIYSKFSAIVIFFLALLCTHIEECSKTLSYNEIMPYLFNAEFKGLHDGGQGTNPSGNNFARLWSYFRFLSERFFARRLV